MKFIPKTLLLASVLGATASAYAQIAPLSPLGPPPAVTSGSVQSGTSINSTLGAGSGLTQSQQLLDGAADARAHANANGTSAGTSGVVGAGATGGVLVGPNGGAGVNTNIRGDGTVR